MKLRTLLNFFLFLTGLALCAKSLDTETRYTRRLILDIIDPKGRFFPLCGACTSHEDCDCMPLFEYDNGEELNRYREDNRKRIKAMQKCRFMSPEQLTRVHETSEDFFEKQYAFVILNFQWLRIGSCYYFFRKIF